MRVKITTRLVIHIHIENNNDITRTMRKIGRTKNMPEINNKP